MANLQCLYFQNDKFMRIVFDTVLGKYSTNFIKFVSRLALINRLISTFKTLRVVTLCLHRERHQFCHLRDQVYNFL